MEWITANYMNVLATVGAIYVAARAIVVLTPTPNDDKALDKIGILLKTLGKLVGLDLTQGYTPGGPK